MSCSSGSEGRGRPRCDDDPVSPPTPLILPAAAPPARPPRPPNLCRYRRRRADALRQRARAPLQAQLRHRHRRCQVRWGYTRSSNPNPNQVRWGYTEQMGLELEKWEQPLLMVVLDQVSTPTLTLMPTLTLTLTLTLALTLTLTLLMVVLEQVSTRGASNTLRLACETLEVREGVPLTAPLPHPYRPVPPLAPRTALTAPYRRALPRSPLTAPYCSVLPLTAPRRPLTQERDLIALALRFAIARHCGEASRHRA